jgi:hypothetical protein
MSNIPLKLYAMVPHFASWFIADIVTLLSHSQVLGVVRFVCLVGDGTDRSHKKLADNHLFLSAET